MNRRTVQIVSTFLGVAGTLFFISLGFNIMPGNYATFAGIACYIIAGAVWTLHDPSKDETRPV